MINDNNCLHPQDDLVLYQEIDVEDQLIFEVEEGEAYYLRDYYCKHEDCNCARIKFSVFLNNAEVGEIQYDYRQARVIEPSEYSFVIAEDQHIEDFNKYLSIRHESLKLTLELSALEEEKKQEERRKRND